MIGHFYYASQLMTKPTPSYNVAAISKGRGLLHDGSRIHPRSESDSMRPPDFCHRSDSQASPSRFGQSATRSGVAMSVALEIGFLFARHGVSSICYYAHLIFCPIAKRLLVGTMGRDGTGHNSQIALFSSDNSEIGLRPRAPEPGLFCPLRRSRSR